MKVSTRFFMYRDDYKEGGPPDVASIEKAKKLGGSPEEVQSVIDVLVANPDKRLNLVEIREDGKKVPLEKYREAAASLRGGAGSMQITLMVNRRKERTGINAYLESIDKVKGGEVSSKAPTSVSFADM